MTDRVAPIRQLIDGLPRKDRAALMGALHGGEQPEPDCPIDRYLVSVAERVLG